VIGKIAKSGHLLSGEMRTEKENSDTVKVHFAKIIEKQKEPPGHLKLIYFETLRKVPVQNSLNDIFKKNNKILNVHGILLPTCL